MQHISLYSQTNCHSTHYDHHSVSLSAGVIISIQSFTSKNAVFFIGALTTTFQLFTPSNSQRLKDDLQPQIPLYLPISLFKTMKRRHSWWLALFQYTNQRRPSSRNRSLPGLTVNTHNHCFTANHHAISQACLTIIAG